jgi:hypothetical protein
MAPVVVYEGVVDSTTRPGVAVLDGQGFVVTWVAPDGQGNNALLARVYSAGGSPVVGGADGWVLLASISTGAMLSQSGAATGPGGSAWVAWVQTASGEVFARKVNQDQSLAAPVGPINALAGGDQRAPAMATCPDGKALLVWESNASPGGNGWDIQGRWLDANGVPIGDEFTVNTELAQYQTEAVVACGPDGRAVVVWQGPELFGQAFDSTHQALGGEFAVNQATANNQYRPVVAACQDGFLVAWESEGHTAPLEATEVLLRRFDYCAANGGLCGNNAHDAGEECEKLLDVGCADDCTWVEFSAAKSTLDASSPVVADGHTASLVVATVKDAAGKPVPGRLLAFKSNDKSAPLQPFGSLKDPVDLDAKAVTDANGQAVIYLTSQVVGTALITFDDSATGAASGLSREVVFSALPPPSNIQTAVDKSGQVLSVAGTPQGAGLVVTITDANWIDPAGLPQSGKPPADDMVFAMGMLSYSATVTTAGGVPVPGAAVSFMLTFPVALAPGTVLYKFGPTAGNKTPHWYDFATQGGVVEFPPAAPNTVVLTITDGSVGDADLQANGVIVDPAGPGVPPESIPTLAEWAVLLLALALLVLGARRLRGSAPAA